MWSCSRDSPTGSGPMVRMSHPVLALDPSLCLGVHRKSLKPSKVQPSTFGVLYSFFRGWNNIIALPPLIFKIFGYKYLLKTILCELLLLYSYFPVWSAKSPFCVHFLTLNTQHQSSLLHICLVFYSSTLTCAPGELDVFDRQAGDQHTTKQPYTA